MMLSFVTILVMLFASSAFGRWYNLFHIIVGAPVAVTELFVWYRWLQWRSEHHTDPMLAGEETPILYIGLGLVNGLALVFVLSCSFWITSAIGLADWFADRACITLFRELDDLRVETDALHTIRLIDENLLQPGSASCRQALLVYKVHMLLARAKTALGDEKIPILETAVTVAQEVTDVTVRQLATAEYTVATARATELHDQGMLARQGRLLALQKAIQALQARQPRLLVQDAGQHFLIIIPGTLFAFGRDTIGPEITTMVHDIAIFARTYCEGKALSVMGHADARGTRETKQKISEARARKVAEVLTRHGILPSLVSTSGVGDTNPLTSETTVEEQAQNRRVEIQIEHE